MNIRVKLALLAFVLLLAIFSVSAAVGGRAMAADRSDHYACCPYQEPDTGM
jgi:hypothetical protein